MIRKVAELLHDDDFILRAGAAVHVLEDVADTWADDSAFLVSFSIRWPAEVGDEYFLVARIEVEGRKMVAFRSAGSLHELLVGFVKAMKYKKLKLREDKYGDGDS